VVEARHALELFSERAEGFGYLLKDRVLEIEDFLDAVRRVGRGGTALEREVLTLMAEGRSNRGVCEKLVPSPKTVESHVNSIFNKLRLAPAPDDHRRVLAVLAFLRS